MFAHMLTDKGSVFKLKLSHKGAEPDPLSPDPDPLKSLFS
jgi:hypothetical protein